LGAVASYLKSNAVSLALPAASRHVPVTDTAVSSGPLYSAGAVHETAPDVASVPLNVTLSGRRYQPLPSGALSALAETAGAVASYLSVASAGALVFPALSVHVALTEAAALSGPEYDCELHPATPETASLPEAVIATAWLNQPFESGSRAGAAFTVGGVASYLNVVVIEALVLPAASVQVPVTSREGPSGPEYWVLVQEATPDVASVPVKATATARLYQPP
jgi:hypothetical protein